MNLIKNRILQLINPLTKVYYNWRYWGNLYREMKKHVEKSNHLTQEKLIPYLNKPGIVFSFDDSYRINDWIKYGKEMFGYYDVKVTFNINAIHHFEGKREHTQNEIDRLLELQSQGHEIAHHGLKHKKAVEYTQEFGLEKWIYDEIRSLFNWMEKQSHSMTKEKFKKPVSFAFPHFIYNKDIIKELVPNYFKIVRGHMNEDNLTPFNFSGFAPSICLDVYYSSNLYYVKKIMKIAKKTGKNLIITCHSILPEEVNWENFGWGKEAIKSGTWRTTPKTIQRIIDEAKSNDFEFYTTSEIAGVATFIDSNFEKSVRKVISNPLEKWISIKELSGIKELDLSNNNITNLDGIQYFLNLEKLNLTNNNITDFRLLKKLPKLKIIETDNNAIKKKRGIR
ncbi:DUF2334 domain-containing protein [Neobacillus sp. PS3-40]|uniref:DUF2334 domain-containing protein n=1 Tax=Neobacillus sp. PS3-40 TaxID=3070679 RepID=UPI0027DF3272|nr:leucine-rich repeat domain-containing protein [Neobacillus sp. PS3-40]WML45807.1 DUF2334 domain-containing protein [Neobacillus sp. PS3-40]